MSVSGWRDRLRFLWEEESPPPEEVPRTRREEPAGVPNALRKATRVALIGVVATSLMGQVIGVRLVASVDAAPDYTSRCIQLLCTGLDGEARLDCYRTCVIGAP
jgi:hypothetical protein